MNVKAIANHIINKLPEMPTLALILGSGQGSFVDSMKGKVTISYSDIQIIPALRFQGM